MRHPDKPAPTLECIPLWERARDEARALTARPAGLWSI